MNHPPIKVQAFLSNIALFRELAPEEIDRIATQTRQIRATRGEILFHRGEEAKNFHIIVFGQVKLAFTSSRGDEKVVDILGPGQSFGEAVMFTDQPHVVSAQALADSLLLCVSREAIFSELDRDPRFARRVIGGLSHRLHHRMADLESYSMRSGTQRVIGFLLHEYRAGKDANAPQEISLPAAKGVIASRLNLTQEHFSRILHELTSEGLIEVRGRDVLIKDVERLRSFDM